FSHIATAVCFIFSLHDALPIYEEETFSSVRRSAPARALWLCINLVSCLVAASVVNLFADTIDKVVALAVLMPIVANMGGVAGHQTLDRTSVVMGKNVDSKSRANDLYTI